MFTHILKKKKIVVIPSHKGGKMSIEITIQFKQVEMCKTKTNQPMKQKRTLTKKTKKLQFNTLKQLLIINGCPSANVMKGAVD